MIASTGYCYPSSETCTQTHYPIYSSYDLYFRSPAIEKPEPFYRKIVTLKPIAEPALTIATPKKRQWCPQMGRVRINRT